MKNHSKISFLTLTAVGLLATAVVPAQAGTIDFSASVQDPLIYESGPYWTNQLGDTMQGGPVVVVVVPSLSELAYGLGQSLGSQIASSLYNPSTGLLDLGTGQSVDDLVTAASRTDDEILANGPTVEAAKQMDERDQARSTLDSMGLGSSYLSADPFASAGNTPAAGTGPTGQETTEPEETSPAAGTGPSGQETTESDAPASGTGPSGQETEEPD